VLDADERLTPHTGRITFEQGPGVLFGLECWEVHRKGPDGLE